MKEIALGQFGIEHKTYKETVELLQSFRMNEIISVTQIVGDWTYSYRKAKIFIRVMSYTMPKLGFFKSTPGEVIAQLPNGTKCPFLNLKYSGEKISISLSSQIQNELDKIASKIDFYSKREYLPNYNFKICIYEDNISLKNDMEEYNRSMARLPELKAQLEKEAMERAAEEKRKQDEYNAQNTSAGQAVNDMFGRM